MIIRALMRNKVRSGLLVVEIAVTLAIVLNCMSLLADQRRLITRDSGLEEADLIAVEILPWAAEYGEDSFRRDLMNRDLEALRRVPGVVDASAVGPFPLQGGGSSTLVRPLGAPKEAQVRAPVYRGDDHVVTTFGLELVAGRDFTPADVPVEPGSSILNVIVTQDLADALFPDGDALGQSLDTGSEEYPDVIVGIVRRMHTPYGGGPMESRIVVYPRPRHSSGFMSYVVRAEPGQRDRLLPVVEETILRQHDGRVIKADPLLEIKARGYSVEHLMIGILTTVIVLLLLVTALGLFGMTSFSVTQRTREVGTRRALGATRGDIVWHFLTEGALVVALGSGLGLVGAFALNLTLVSSMDASRLAPGLTLAGLAVLWAVGVTATLAPALRASRLPPVLATQTV